MEYYVKNCQIPRNIVMDLNGKYQNIFCGILSSPKQNIVMNLNNVMVRSLFKCRVDITI